jgi:hypothetical protein
MPEEIDDGEAILQEEAVEEGVGADEEEDD